MKSFVKTPDKHDGGVGSYITKGDLPGNARPESPAYDRAEERYGAMGMMPPMSGGAPHGPGQATSYKVPVKKSRENLA